MYSLIAYKGKIVRNILTNKNRKLLEDMREVLQKKRPDIFMEIVDGAPLPTSLRLQATGDSIAAARSTPHRYLKSESYSDSRCAMCGVLESEHGLI